MPLTDTHPAQVRAWIRMQGSNPTVLAREAGLEPSACRVALIRSHLAGERVIAEFLGKTPRDLWPARIAKREGKPIARRRRAHRLKRRAA